MKWPVALAITAIVFCGGCRNYQGRPATDPFFGRTRVVPPATGRIVPGAVDPYYGAAPSSRMVPVITPGVPSTAAPQSIRSGTTTPNPVPHNAPPSPYLRSGTQSREAAPARTAIRVPPPSYAERDAMGTIPDISLPAADDPEPRGRLGDTILGRLRPKRRLFTRSNVPFSERERFIRILPPRPQATPRLSQRVTAVSVAKSTFPVAKSTFPQPRPLRTASRPVDIMDLPPVHKSESTGAPRPIGSTPSGSSVGIRPVSAIEPVEASRGASRGASNVVPAVASSPTSPAHSGTPGFARRSNYSHDATYEKLRGRLEYSQLDRCWKLRYIPIDGETDKYGGSVILPDPTVLHGCERGDFVEVEGRIDREDPKKGFAPKYHVAKVKRL